MGCHFLHNMRMMRIDAHWCASDAHRQMHPHGQPYFPYSHSTATAEFVKATAGFVMSSEASDQLYFSHFSTFRFVLGNIWLFSCVILTNTVEKVRNPSHFFKPIEVTNSAVAVEWLLLRTVWMKTSFSSWNPERRPEIFQFLSTYTSASPNDGCGSSQRKILLFFGYCTPNLLPK